MRVRGLKLHYTNNVTDEAGSHPMWVRGLKPLCEPPLLSY